MTQALAVLSGIMIAVMILINGDLAATYGNMTSTVLIHLIGLIAITLILLLRREPRPKTGRIPLYLCLGGVVGVFTTFSNILTFGALGVSLTLALGLLGQSVLSLLIDSFGWFGVKKQPLQPQKLAGIGVIGLGALMMLIL